MKTTTIALISSANRNSSIKLLSKSPSVSESVWERRTARVQTGQRMMARSTSKG